MDQLVQCPVCTLFLHNGMSLESHLDTHPKDQVIKALCNLSKNTNYGSRTPTPSQSERSYRSRSRTPATEDSNLKWNGSRSGEHDRYWRRTPSRTPSRTPKASNSSRVTTPASDVRLADISFENSPVNNSNSYSSSQYPMKLDKTQQTFMPNSALSDFDQQYVYYPDQQEDREIKYSRSAEYGAIDSSVFTHNTPIAPAVKLPASMLPAVPRKGHDLVKILPKPNNLLVKTNMGGVQYLAPGVKPMHVMVPTTPTFVQKNVQNNMIMTSNLPTSQMLDNKAVGSPLPTSQFNQISSGAFTPGTTVVTQNSQIIYREMVHNIDGKPFISSMPAILGGHENVTNVAQTSSLYQNVMVVDQFGNTSCMYTSPQQLIPNNVPPVSNAQVEKTEPNTPSDFNKTLIIEVGPIVPPEPVSACEASVSKVPTSTQSDTPRGSKHEKIAEKLERIDTPGSSKGLKILSNIKVEVPVQHHKNMLNTILDLTGPNDSDYQERPLSPEKILPDLDDNHHSISNDSIQLSTPNSSADSLVSHSFSVIKNVGNPPSYKEATKSGDSKIDSEFSDSCPVPDLICNEKPSISPCSELSEHGENSRDNISISPKPESKHGPHSSSHPIPINNKEHETKFEQKPRAKVYNNPLRLNNIYVKKNKKVLQIKNAKTATTSSASKCVTSDPAPSSSLSKAPENFTMNKLHQENREKTLQTVSIEKIKDSDDQNEFDADTEEQSMDIEPVAPSTLTASQFATSVDIVQVKEEINTSNESAFSNEAGSSDRHLTPLETLRPINVITYGNMPPGDFDDESNHRELLDLEAASKNKQFVNMMNENYFGDNIYADYFTPDRVESFDDREPPHHTTEKEGMYIWGEPSQKGNAGEFVLPNFIHESYKIAESNYSEMEGNDGCERDSKADVLSEGRSEGEPPLNICADERMPPRGELSGQESNGDMESPWNGMYPDVPPAEPYDLMARESWVSDGSDVDASEKRETLDEEMQFSKGRDEDLQYPKSSEAMPYPKRDDDIQFPKARLHTCTQCGAKYPTLKELRGHKALMHALPTSSGTKTSYSRMVTARTIKKEEKTDDNILGGNLMMDNKEALASTMLTVYEAMAEAKPRIETLIKQETKRRRKDYVCPTCKVDQVTEAAFHMHLKLHPLECLTCGKCFYRRANLALHVKTHFGIKNYRCEICEKRFVTRQKLREHQNTHSGRAPVKCTHCEQTFRRYSNMVQHRDRHHYLKKLKVRDFVCHCGAVFHSKAKLLWHKETHDEKPKSCQYCSEKFVHSSSLTRHVRRTHNEYYVPDKNKGKVENVTCPVCKQVYLRTNLRAHLLTHSGKRPYVCIICNKSFTTKWNLKLHRWTHMSRSAKPFKCSLCKGAFIRHTEYISHMNSHKSVRPYTCNYCGCQFIRKYNCQRHVREHEMEKKYVCKVPECGKSFHRSYYLSEHMKVHSGARPFSCSICGKTSSNKPNHNKHLKIHHAREPIATEA
ncbi:uncharacterized protein LOC126369927 isoform X2 [Pectinophora gossypiella]|uniref:uncharacterized protein LOC126369927 isoform X2 n=1 Tax=Pectinophora gossypiella TaxID=13191 RepID=UPI00214E4940|nr:uncharacterized protein LOC126369927 isoform X2 [Pectinophora gossypiella]